MWVKNRCYKNTRIVNRATGNHLIILGLLIFHFTKDKSTFSCFALEMMAVDNNISSLKKIGSDKVESIQSRDSWSKSIVLCLPLASTWWKKNLMGYFIKQNSVYWKEIAPTTKSLKIYTVIRKIDLLFIYLLKFIFCWSFCCFTTSNSCIILRIIC